MATKKQNRRGKVRRVRRALNRGLDVGSKMAGRRLYRSRHGEGMGLAQINRDVLCVVGWSDRQWL